MGFGVWGLGIPLDKTQAASVPYMLVFAINLNLFGLAAGQCRANVTNGSGRCALLVRGCAAG